MTNPLEQYKCKHGVLGHCDYCWAEEFRKRRLINPEYRKAVETLRKREDKMIRFQLDKLDRALAERLMGWTWKEETIEGFDHSHWIDESGLPALSDNWSPTRNISQALGNGEKGTVVNEMETLKWRLQLNHHDRWISLSNNPFTAIFWPIETDDEELDDNRRAKAASENTPALAICVAACKALGIDVEEAS